MRLFTGIRLPDDVAARVAEAISQFRPVAPLRWSPPANLHITTQFIGAWPDHRVTDLISTLNGMDHMHSFEVRLEGLSWFPNPHHPRIFCVAVKAEPPAALEQLAARTNQSLAAVGITPETRRYNPHLTLARIDQRKHTAGDLAALRRAVAAMDRQDFGRFACSSFHLYESRQDQRGSEYSILSTFPLLQLT